MNDRIKKLSSQNGFTLIELLVVIGILAILLAITLIAINPQRHFRDSRNAQRSSNVSELLNGIYEYQSTNNGTTPPSVANVSLTMPLGKATTYTATATSFAAPNLTLSGLTANVITAGNVLISGCTQAADNGSYPVVSGTATTLVVNNATASAVSATGCTIKSAIDVCTDLAPAQIADLPTDPSSGSITGGATPCAVATTAYTTGYTISASNNRYTIAAPSAEGGAIISVTR